MKSWCRIILMLCCTFSLSHAQKVVLLVETDQTDVWKKRASLPLKIEKDTVETSLWNEIEDLRSGGYFEANLDTLTCGMDTCVADVHIGKKYDGLRLFIPDSTIRFFGQRLLAPLLEQPYLSIREWEAWRRILLEKAVNNGYPFAQLRLNNLSFHEDAIAATLLLRQGRPISFNEVHVTPEEIVSAHFLQNYLQWRKGMPFNEQLATDVERRINDLPYLKLTTEPKVNFVYDNANLNLKLERDAANRFDFLLGVLPPGDQQDRKLILSVLLHTELYNLLGQGEYFEFRFTNTKPKAQELIFNFEYPYILSMPFGLKANFELFRNVDANLDVIYSLGGFYAPDPDVKFGAYYRRIGSSVLEVDTGYVIQNKRLPENLDFVQDRIGLDFEWNALDSKLAPTNGWRLEFDLSLGLKEISRQQDLLELESPEVSIDSLYESIELKSQQISIQLKASRYFRIQRRWSILLQEDAGWLFGSDAFLFNELFRVGGNRRLRGFDEEFFRVDGFAIQTIEIRFLLDRSSYFSAFYDLAYLERRGFDNSFTDIAHGFGLGFNFKTPIGLFNLSYALGGSRRTPLDLNAGKIHFGFVNVF